MSNLYVCNTSSDNISVVNIEDFKEVYKIPLSYNSEHRIGPHGICTYKDKLIVANNYSNTISIIDTQINKEVASYFIGMHCNDAAVYKDKAYVICGELNYIIVFNLLTNKVDEEIPCGNLPHSIKIDKQRKHMLISNFENDSITLVDLNDNKNIKHVRVGAYPTKALFTIDGDYILVCESNIGTDVKGSISIISSKNYKLLNRILVGNCPVDMYLDTSYCYVSNFGEGTISMVDINLYNEIKKINVGGMPRGIIKRLDYIYVGDNYNNILIRVNEKEEKKRVISIGGEPNGMTFFSPL
ncbi:YncE family protein [Clostridium sp. MB40-C1]|uniref:YncE family protein n=1 Tax=Clostridium sp. MB40-C1 TaxID=3070996 RepID=UPI0027E06E3C|nr:YncE family protein [Clostridium sp. MB40-C1]WMJ81078.1 YncE family protein [Clostridium sp. MB40-C1]